MDYIFVATFFSQILSARTFNREQFGSLKTIHEEHFPILRLSSAYSHRGCFLLLQP